jgi:mono/diheme cytochrome c family protein
VDLRSILERNGWLLVSMGVFALPLAVLSLVSGLNAGIAAALFLIVAVGAMVLLRISTGGPIDWRRRVSRVRAIGSAALSALVVGLIIQAVPYGWDTDNPPGIAEPAWDSPRTRELVVKACFDCHSNEVDYPWYSRLALVSWAVQSHVEAGRNAVNYSEWNRYQKKADESAETVEEASMPPWYYTLVRPGLLSDVEKQDLIRGLEATLGRDDEGDDDDDDEDDDD